MNDMLLAVGPGVILPLFAALAFGIPALAKTFGIGRRTEEFFRPGTRPGTVTPGTYFPGEAYRDELTALLGPETAGQLLETAREASYYDPNAAMLLGQIVEEGGVRSRLQDVGRRGAETQRGVAQKVSEAAAGVKGQLEEIRTNPNIFASESELRQMVAKLQGEAAPQFAERQRALESAGGRALPLDVVRAGQELIGSEQIAANQQIAADVAIANAVNRAQRQLEAERILGGLLATYGGLESQLGTTAAELETLGQYPLNLLAPGESLSRENWLKLLMLNATDAQQAEFFMNLATAGLDFALSRLNAQMLGAGAGGQRGNLGGLLSGIGMLSGAGIGNYLLPGIGGTIGGAFIGGGAGQGIGSAIPGFRWD